MNKQGQPRRQTACHAFHVLAVAMIALGLTMTAIQTEGLSVSFIGAGVAFLAIGLGGRTKASMQPPLRALPNRAGGCA